MLEAERLKSWESRLKLEVLQSEEKSRALHKDRAELEQREVALKQARAVRKALGKGEGKERAEI